VVILFRGGSGSDGGVVVLFLDFFVLCLVVMVMVFGGDGLLCAFLQEFNA
jgi:hypothetical protein